jgi:ATPase subunit of ABC transporter with duplicated ATPase domains
LHLSKQSFFVSSVLGIFNSVHVLISDIFDGGIATVECKKELHEEKEAEKNKLEQKKEEAIKDIRDEYMNRIKNAKNAADKERLLTEMQKRINAAEDEMDRARKQQLKTLEKNLKAR